jgi:hypothetical protein
VSVRFKGFAIMLMAFILIHKALANIVQGTTNVIYEQILFQIFFFQVNP